MSKTLVVSDDLYERLEQAAHRRGLQSIHQLLESWQMPEEALHKRREAVERIDTLRGRLFRDYGKMPDSTDLIREDRTR